MSISVIMVRGLRDIRLDLPCKVTLMPNSRCKPCWPAYLLPYLSPETLARTTPRYQMRSSLQHVHITYNIVKLNYPTKAAN